MYEITATVNGKKVPLNKLADAAIDEIQKLLIENVKEQVEERINNSGIKQELLDKSKILLIFEGDSVQIDVEGPEEVETQIQKLFEDEDDSE